MSHSIANPLSPRPSPFSLHPHVRLWRHFVPLMPGSSPIGRQWVHHSARTHKLNSSVMLQLPPGSSASRLRLLRLPRQIGGTGQSPAEGAAASAATGMEGSGVEGMRSGQLSEQLLNWPLDAQSAGETGRLTDDSSDATDGNEETVNSTHGSMMTSCGKKSDAEGEDALARRGVLGKKNGESEGNGRLRFGIEAGKGVSNNTEALPGPWAGVTQARTPTGLWWMENSPKQQQREMGRELLPISQAGGAQVPSEDYSALKRTEWEDVGGGKEGIKHLLVKTSSTSAKEASTLRDSRRVKQPIMAAMMEGDIEYVLATHNYARYRAVRARGMELSRREGMGIWRCKGRRGGGGGRGVWK